MRASWVSKRVDIRTRRRIISDIITAKVMKPSPPTSIKRAITACPNTVQWVAVLTRVRPVTQVALVDVKNAVIKLVWAPLTVAQGKSSSRVPLAITSRKPSVRILGNEYFRLLISITFLVLPFISPVNYNRFPRSSGTHFPDSI